MRASEKLKAMLTEAQGEFPKGTDPQVYAALACDLMDTLPQIRAVVFRAEVLVYDAAPKLEQEFPDLKEGLEALAEVLP